MHCRPNNMLGNEYESFLQALLWSVKSTQILHFPFYFFTMTISTFASHSGKLDFPDMASFHQFVSFFFYTEALVLSKFLMYQNITSGELPWSINTRCTLRPIVITDRTTWSSLWEKNVFWINRCKTEKGNRRGLGRTGFWKQNCPRIALSARYPRPSPRKPPNIVLKSPKIGALWSGLFGWSSPSRSFSWGSWR